MYELAFVRSSIMQPFPEEDALHINFFYYIYSTVCLHGHLTKKTTNFFKRYIVVLYASLMTLKALE